MKTVSGIARNCRRGRARLITSATSTAAMVAALSFAMPARGADLGYGPYPPQPYGYQPPPYDDGPTAYPPQRYWPPHEGPYGQHRSLYQPPPYGPAYPSQRYLSSRVDPYGEPYTYEPRPFDYRGPPYPSHRYVPSRPGVYGEERYGNQNYDQRARAYPYYRPEPNGYGYREGSYRPYGYMDPSYDPGAGIEPDAPRPPAPILGPPRGRIADSREPPFEAWSAYPPRRW
jgi:hypothetical protein